MPRRTWDATTQALIVLAGLTGTSVAERGPEHQIRQSPSDHWREPFLAHAAQAFEAQQRTRTDAHLAQENARWKQLVGERTFECKQATSGGADAPPVAAGQPAR